MAGGWACSPTADDCCPGVSTVTWADWLVPPGYSSAALKGWLRVEATSWLMVRVTTHEAASFLRVVIPPLHPGRDRFCRCPDLLVPSTPAPPPGVGCSGAVDPAAARLDVPGARVCQRGHPAAAANGGQALRSGRQGVAQDDGRDTAGAGRHQGVHAAARSCLFGGFTCIRRQ